MAENQTPTPAESTETSTEEKVPGKVKTFLTKHKRTIIAAVAGVGVGAAAMAKVKADGDDSSVAFDTVEGEVLYSTTDVPSSEA